MDCLTCANKELTNQHHDRKVMEGLPPQLHIHCDQCDEVFVVYKNKAGNLDIKYRDR